MTISDMRKKLVQKLEEIDAKHISDGQKELEAEEVMIRDWKIEIEEIPFGDKDGVLLVIHPSYVNKPHLLNFLSEAQPHMIAFLNKHLKNGPIKCTFKLELVGINKKRNVLSNSSISSFPVTWNNVSDISGLQVNELYNRYEHLVTTVPTSDKGYEFDEIKRFEIIALQKSVF